MVLDTNLSLLTYIYDRLTTDATLKSACGGTVRLYPVQASPDTEFPFMVHRFDGGQLEPFPMRETTYYLDIFSNTDNVTEVLSIRQRIMTLIDQYSFSTTEVQSARMWLQTDGFVGDIEDGIWHYTLQFNMRFYRKSEIAAILAR